MADMRLMKSINPNNPSGSHGLIGTTLAEQMEITDREIGFRKRILGFTRNHELRQLYRHAHHRVGGSVLRRTDKDPRN